MGLEDETYNELTKWCQGKPTAVALLAPSIAFVADPLERFILEPSWQKHRDKLAPISPEERRRYYQSCTDLLRDFGRDVPIEGIFPINDACDTLDAIRAPDFDHRRRPRGYEDPQESCRKPTQDLSLRRCTNLLATVQPLARITGHA